MQLDLKKPAGVMLDLKFAWVWFFTLVVAIAFLTAFGPAEHSLGTHIRIVYLHGAWVWAALVAFMLGGLLGIVSLLIHRDNYYRWSEAFGRTGLFFWITYLPLSLIAMETNWNGLFLAEPRWKLALVFAIAGILLQAGLSLADTPSLTAGLNLVFLMALIFALVRTPNVMHPSAPIFNSHAWRIQLYFLGLVLLTLLAMWQMARWLYKNEPIQTRR
jgi:hypothetical protein